MDIVGGIYFLLGLFGVTSGRSAGSRPGATGNSCRLADLQMQQNFDLKRFQGKWFGTYKTGMGDSILSYFTEIYDTRISFKLNSEGNFDIAAVGSKFYGSWCPYGKGHAAMPLPDEPEKMTMYFDTRVGRQIGMKPGWLLKTDYDNYAIIYSCWSERKDGTCEPSSAYIGVMQRHDKQLSDAKMAEVLAAVKSACVDTKRLSPISHYGYCTKGHDGL